MATVAWQAPEAVVAYLGVGLNGLVNGANAVGAAVDNETGLYPWINIELALALQPGVRAAGAYVAIYVLPSLDGITFDMGNGVDPADDAFVVFFAFDAAATARTRVKVNIPLPPLQFTMLVMNETGQNFAAAGNTVRYRRHYGDVT